MAPPRKPVQHLRLVGSYRRDRHASRDHEPVPTGELGPAPDCLDGPGECEAWAELSAAAPWCTAADRMIVELVARMLAMSRRERMPAAYLAQLQQALGRLGLTPADRKRVLIRPPEPPREQSAFAKLAAKRRGQ